MEQPRAAIEPRRGHDRRRRAAKSALPADLVYVMTGFAPNIDLLRQVGVPIDPATGIPAHDPRTLETDVPGLFIAGVVVAGFDANKVFIENGRFHGDKIVARISAARLARRAEAERRAR